MSQTLAGTQRSHWTAGFINTSAEYSVAVRSFNFRSLPKDYMLTVHNLVMSLACSSKGDMQLNREEPPGGNELNLGALVPAQPSTGIAL